MAEIVLDKVTKRFPDGTEAVKEADFTIDDGEFFILVGPVGLREVDAAQHDRRPRGHQRGRRCGSATRSSTTSTPRTATWRWCSRATPSTRT